MGRRTTLLAGTMIFWLPVLFLTTYIGFYEAYKGAMENGFLGFNYPQEFATMLIIPAMIPTIFTAHAILNKEKMTTRLIEKLNLFHAQAVTGDNEFLEDSLLTNKEYESLDFIQKIEYSKDLMRVGKSTLSNKLLHHFFETYHASINLEERAAGFYSRTLISDVSVNEKEKFRCSEEGYNLILRQPDSALNSDIIFRYILMLPYLGYENGLARMREIEIEVSDQYILMQIEIRKLYFLYRMNRISDIDFTSIQEKIDPKAYTKTQLNQLESQLANVKESILLSNEEFDKLEEFLKNRVYYQKWSGSVYDNVQNQLGRMYRKMGLYEKALKAFNADLTSSKANNLPYDEGVALVNLGKTNMLMGNYDAVKHYAKDSLHLFTEMDFARGIIESLTLTVKARKNLGEDSNDELLRLTSLEKEHGIIADED